VSKFEYALMTPSEIVAAKSRCPVAFVPVSPLEWHGPHLPLGMDGLHAAYLARQLAQELGGVLLPTLFLGTETVRPPGSGPEQLGALGLDDDSSVVGMDFPGNSVRSLYIDEGAFGIAIREVVRALTRDSFRLVVLVNGHAALNHQRTLERIAREETHLPSVSVLNLLAFERTEGPDSGDGVEVSIGHADRVETEILLAIDPDLVHLDNLPAGPLPYADHGIIDAAAFEGQPAEGFLLPVEDDPRSATLAEGEARLARELDFARRAVTAELERLSESPTPGSGRPLG
jgi:creatinine amidohydrolase